MHQNDNTCKSFVFNKSRNEKRKHINHVVKCILEEGHTGTHEGIDGTNRVIWKSDYPAGHEKENDDE